MSITTVKERIQIAKDEKLLFLDLRGLMLSELPDEICELTFVIDIDLSYNQFITLPVQLTKLGNLLSLDLSHNYIMEIDFQYSDFNGLRNLNISHNYLYSIPKCIDYLRSTDITFNNNPFLNGLPAEIEYYDFHQIIYYLDLIRDDREIHKFYETKLIFVGGGEVGKTTLMKVLQKPDYKVELGKELTTHGININSLNYDILFPVRSPHYNNYKDIDDVYILEEYLPFNGYFTTDEDEDENEQYEDEDEDMPTFVKDGMRYIPLTNSFVVLDDDERAEIVISKDITKLYSNIVVKKEVKINLWDFGGQEIYHATHQFFLTKRSIYIFVWEPRKDNNEDDFDYWLNTIKLLSADSPVIVVMNKSDIRFKNIDEKTYANKFTNICNFFTVSCLKKQGISELQEQIEKCIKQMPHIGDKIPASWIKVREKVKKVNDDFTSYSYFIAICNENKSIVDKNEIALFSEYMHDIGEIIHFKEDSILRNIVIINPQWATKAVYILIDTIEVQQNNGIFDINELENYWDTRIYPIEKHIELLQLMEKFEICFKLVGGKNTYVIPELLKTEIPNIGLADEIQNDNSLKFQIRYEFMPSGLITKLICRLYYLIYKNNYWKNGVIFINDMARAVVISNTSQKKISISISGNQKGNLLAIIRNELNSIHAGFNMKDVIDYKEEIPCNCDVCKEGKPFYFGYNVLKNFLSKDKFVIDCHYSALTVDINELIFGYQSVKSNKKIIHEIIAAASQLQGQNKNIVSTEDARNSFISGRLSYNGIASKDQSRWGSSGAGVNQGELDIKIEDGKGNIITIFEGLNLNTINTTILSNHIEKTINNYDVNGLLEKFIGVYYGGKDFDSFSKKYLSFMEVYKSEKLIFKNTIDDSEGLINQTEIKIFKSRYERTSREVYLYHILINLA